MTIVRGATNAYGPGSLDIQIEQGADFILLMNLLKGGAAWNLSGVALEAHFSSKWLPSSGQCVPLVVSNSSGSLISISFPAASSLALALPNTPQSSPSFTNSRAPRVFKLGGWVLNATEGGITTRLISGDVQMERDPCLM